MPPRDGAPVTAPQDVRESTDAVPRAKTELRLGLDAAIGYSSHTAETVDLYFRETLTFRVNTSEASVVITRWARPGLRHGSPGVPPPRGPGQFLRRNFPKNSVSSSVASSGRTAAT